MSSQAISLENNTEPILVSKTVISPVPCPSASLGHLLITNEGVFKCPLSRDSYFA